MFGTPPSGSWASRAVKREVPEDVRKYAEIAAGLAPTPASDIMSARDALEALKQKDYLGAGLGFFSALPFIPNIVSPKTARKIDMPVELPKTPEFSKAVQNDPTAKITDEGLLIKLRRQQKPEQAGQESVRTGVFYLPEGNVQSLRHFKESPKIAGRPTPPTYYGGSAAFAGETLLKRPLFVKGAVGGKAPEKAFETLKGKQAKKELDNDISELLGASSAFSKDPEVFVEFIQRILKKHGGDPTMAKYIIDNSKKGNQLRYAVQENIIANVVRNAGYDSVLGYSKGRKDKGEFFSEVFDVREKTYPSAEGASVLNEKFSNLLNTGLENPLLK